MKKTKLIAVSLVIAVILMGAGYAYWQEDLTVTNTVTTGDLNIIFEKNSASDYDNATPKDKDYVDVDVYDSNEGKNLTFTLDKLYPGAGGKMSFKIRNVGTVPAKVKEIVPIITAEDEAKANELIFRVNEISYFRRGIFGEYEQHPILQTPIVEDDFSDFVDTLENRLQKRLDILNYGEDLVLEPGGYLEIRAAETGYNIEVPKEVDNNNTILTEGATITFDLGIKFEQGE